MINRTPSFTPPTAAVSFVARRALAAALLLAIALPLAAANGAGSPGQPGSKENGKLTVTVGKSLILDSPVNIQRLSVANGDLVEAVAVNPKEVLINGKAPGETTLVIWQEGGNRLPYDLTVRMNQTKLEAVRSQLAKELPDQDVTLVWENETAFLRGTVKDLFAADRALTIASTMGKTVNLLRVVVPPPETQILLKVRFANVDRAAATDLGAALASTAGNQLTGVSTGQFGAATLDSTKSGSAAMTFSDALNVFLFRKDLNLGVAIKALQSKSLLEVLAEPNVLAINGKAASFVSGGEFPFPMVQGGATSGAVTVQFREYGIRINFLPQITARGTIRLQVAPEVSSLDYTNALTISGFTIPGLSLRKISTEVELESGQSFVIAGLLNNQIKESFTRIPGLADIPLLGKLFQGKSVTKSNTELLVLITPEVVRPIPAGQKPPELHYSKPFMPPNTEGLPRTPGMDKTGPVPVTPASDSMPVEQLMQEKAKPGQSAPSANTPPFQLVPVTTPTSPAATSNSGLLGSSNK
jgi:pilus assembly protein CpaC